MDTSGTLTSSLPQYLNEAKQSISSTFEYFNSMDAYYLKDDIRKDVNIKGLLNSKYSEEVLEGIKFLVGNLITEGNITQYIDNIISKIPSEEYEIKLFCFYLLAEIISIDNKNQSILMSINILMKDFLSVKNLVRGMAVRTLAHTYKHELKEQIIEIIHKGCRDKSVFVRRICAIALYKVHYLAKDEKTSEDLKQYLEILFNDFPAVSGIAFIIYSKIYGKNNLDYLHPYFRNICKNQHLYSDFEGPIQLNLLHRYAIIYFSKSRDSDGKYSDDFTLLLDTCKKLEFVYNPSMFSEVIKIYMKFDQNDAQKRVAIKIFRYFNASAEIKSVFINYAMIQANKFPYIYSNEYNKFFCYNLERQQCKEKKLAILPVICVEENSQAILDELYFYVDLPDMQTAKFAIQSIAKICVKLGKLQNNYLIKLLKREDLNVTLMAEVVKGLSNFIKHQKTKEQKEKNQPQIAYLSTFLPKLKNKEAQICLFEQQIEYYEYLPSILSELLKSLIKGYSTNQCNNMKILCLRLNLKLLLSIDESHKHHDSLVKLFVYLLSKFQKETACSILSYYNVIMNMIRSFVGEGLTENINTESMKNYIKVIKEHKKVIYPEYKDDTSKTNFDGYVNSFDFNMNADIDSLFSYVGQYTKDYIEYPDEDECLIESTDHLRSQSETTEKYTQPVTEKTQTTPNIMTKEDSITDEQEPIEKPGIKSEEQNKPEEVQQEKNEIVSEDQIKDVNNMLDDFFED